jgi:hypothetical protein
LAHFGDYLDKYKIDVLQVRPIRKLGNTEYSDFDLKKQEDKYSAVVANLTEKCKQQGVVSLINSKLPEQKLFRFTLDVANYTYCYVAPEHIGNKDYNPETENYPKFLRRYGFLKNILKDVFLRRNLKFEDNIAFASYDVNL